MSFASSTPCRRLTITTGLVALAALVCGVADAGVPVAPPYDPTDACASWRWIGIKADPDGRCPLPVDPAWTVRHLFAGTGECPGVEEEEPLSGEKDLIGCLPPGLRPFCVYEHPTGGTARDILDLVPGMLAAVERDCLGVASTSGALETETWGMLSQSFLKQAGAMIHQVSGGPPVRVAVLDTHPTHLFAPEQVTATSPHGYTLINMAHQLLCNPDSTVCTVDLVTHLALPYLNWDSYDPTSSVRDDVNGGLVGTLGDLAAAIREAVGDWQQSAPGSHLVLHLAVAWDGNSFGGVEGTRELMPPAARSVYAALEDAACRGALVVAAAGNKSGGPVPELGPLLPGGWETRTAPTIDDCASVLGEMPAVKDPSEGMGSSESNAGQPLLWAAGGITTSGRPLANARPGGMPRLAAIADHAVVEGHIPGAPTATLTGSSVATTVVASAAAAVWYYRYGLNRFEVMEQLYAAADDLGIQADFCAGSSPSSGCVPNGFPQTVRRVSVCQTVTAACTGVAGGCPLTSSCPAWVPALPLVAADSITAFNGFPKLAFIDARWLRSGPEPACSPEILFPNPDVYPDLLKPPHDPCPHHQYFGISRIPWELGSQPGSNPCPNCLFSMSHVSLLIEIDSSFTGSLSSPTLNIGGNTYNLAPVLPGSTAEVSMATAPPSGTEVTLSFTVDGSKSVTSPVLVVP